MGLLRLVRFVLLAACAGGIIGALPAGAQDKPITMIVPYGKGGGSDQLSRAMVSSIESFSKSRFDVVNIKEGSGLGALPKFMELPADGYTVIEHIDDITSAYAIGTIDIHPGKDWKPLSIVQLTFSQLFIRADDPRFSDWKSFLAYAQEKDKRVAIANVSYDGSMENLTMRALENALGFKTRQISFPNVKDRYEAVFTGRADALFEQPGDIRKYLDSGRLKPILTFFNERPSAFSKVPTHKEVGADFEPLLRFRGFFVKKDVPPDRLAYLERIFAQGFATKSFQDFNESKFMTIVDPYRGPKDAVKLIDQTIESYSKNYQDFLLQTLNEYFKR
ncbi:MAG: tripartite tricarboxylate transporter substrate binding protein [Alphaproteobacteria bacterium]|nr:tripartite tricarboxylate transporter substrate binding protein [Alphaproteobacteria bacterium]